MRYSPIYKKAVLLGKGIDNNNTVVEVKAHRFESSSSLCSPIHREFNMGAVADSLAAVAEAGLYRVPLYLLGEGIVAVVQTAEIHDDTRSARNHSIFDSTHPYAERLSLLDAEGILGIKGKVYLVTTQNVGFFSNDHIKLKEIAGQRTEYNHDPFDLDQAQVNAILEGLKDKDPLTLFKQQGWVNGDASSIYVFKGDRGLNEFDNASQSKGFLDNMPGYVLVERTDELRETPWGYHPLDVQRQNSFLRFNFGGKEPLEKIMDTLSKLRYTTFCSAPFANLKQSNWGVLMRFDGASGVYYDAAGSGYSLGIARDELAKRREIVAPLPVIKSTLDDTVAVELRRASVTVVSASKVVAFLVDQLGCKPDEVICILGQMKA